MSHLTISQKEELSSTAKFLVASGKGLLAANESSTAIHKYLEAAGVKGSTENARKYRQLLFTSNKTVMSKYISGVILTPETLYQKADDGTPLVQVLQERNLIPGVKMDKGVVRLANTCDELTTEGMDGLAQRCQEYHARGIHFAEWRCVFRVGPGEPSRLAMEQNAYLLAQFASICQVNGLCPIVQAELLSDGDHDLESCMAATEKTLACVCKALRDCRVYLEGMLVETNMILPGHDYSKRKYTQEQVAEATMTVLLRTIPAAIPGVALLSSGQSEIDSTAHLHAINSVENMARPWKVTFSFAGALQASTMKTWRGKLENVAAAQMVFLHRAKCNSLASMGKYEGEEQSGEAARSLFEPNHIY